MKRHSKTFFFLGCLCIAVTAAIVHHYAYDLYTCYWHWMYKGSIHWYDLEIKIPEKLVSRIIENTAQTKEIQIYKLANPNQVDIFFERVSYHLNRNFDFEKKYECAGYRIIEIKPYRILDYPCVWIKSIKEGETPAYSEDLFFLSRDIRISFIGYTDSRHFFEEVIDTLQIRRKSGRADSLPDTS